MVENGKRLPSFEFVMALSKVLDADYSDLALRLLYDPLADDNPSLKAIKAFIELI